MLALAADPGFTPVVSGATADGGSFEVALKKTRISGIRGICINLDYTDPTGFQPGAAGGCIAGDLSAAHALGPVAATTSSDGALKSSLIGGVVVARARRITIRFDDGKTLTTPARRAPKGYGRELGARVRYFGADALAVSPSTPRTAIAYNQRGRRITKVAVTKRQ